MFLLQQDKQRQGAIFQTQDAILEPNMNILFVWYKIRKALSWLPAAAAKSLQSCPTLCDPTDGSPPVPGILQARALEWVAISWLPIFLHKRSTRFSLISFGSPICPLITASWTLGEDKRPRLRERGGQEEWFSPSPSSCIFCEFAPSNVRI